MFTRSQRLEGKCTHEEYYRQFVTPGILKSVESALGAERLAKALEADEHLNNIPLQRWDGLANYIIVEGIRQNLKKHGDFFSLAGGVCICKEAARMIVEEL